MGRKTRDGTQKALNTKSLGFNYRAIDEDGMNRGAPGLHV